MLCSLEEPGDFSHANTSSINTSGSKPTQSFDSTASSSCSSYPVPDLDDFVTQFYNDYPNCKQFISDFYTSSRPGQGGGGDADAAEEAYKDDKDEEDWTGDVSESETLVTETIAGDGVTLSSSDEQLGTISGGFLLANQVVGEQPIDEGPAPLVGGGSLPDSDSQEDLAAQQAMSAVQDSLTSLLGANSVESARDSGIASLDRSPDAPLLPVAAPNIVDTITNNNTNGELQHLSWQQVYQPPTTTTTSIPQCSCDRLSPGRRDSESCLCSQQQPAPGLVVSPVPRFNYAENWDVLQQQPPPGGGGVSIRRIKASGPSPRKAGRREASPLRPSKRQQMTTHNTSR